MSDEYSGFMPVAVGENFKRHAELWGENDDHRFDASTWESRDNCYVYLIAADVKFKPVEGEEWADEIIKVGISSNPWSRLAGFQTASPFRLRLVNTWKLFNRTDALWVEKSFHKCAKRYRTAGEWFRYNVNGAAVTIDSFLAEWWIERTVRNFGGAVEFLMFAGLDKEHAENTILSIYGFGDEEDWEPLEVSQ